jgi:DNA-binding GntR family transcriptional regulator
LLDNRAVLRSYKSLVEDRGIVDEGALQRPQSLTDAVVAYIRDAIISGRFGPGQQLTEGALSQTLGTSRGTVREAMRVLANLGLVSLNAHRGASVTTLTPTGAREIYTLRAVLESFAARTAAEAGLLDATAIGVLEERDAALDNAVHAGDVGAMVEADIRFHETLSAMARHQLLLEHLHTIQAHSRRLLIHSELYRTDAETVSRRHLVILEAIRAGDPEQIERIVSEHIAEVGRDIVARMSADASLSRFPPVDGIQAGPGQAESSTHSRAQGSGPPLAAIHR